MKSHCDMRKCAPLVHMPFAWYKSTCEPALKLTNKLSYSKINIDLEKKTKGIIKKQSFMSSSRLYEIVLHELPAHLTDLVYRFCWIIAFSIGLFVVWKFSVSLFKARLKYCEIAKRQIWLPTQTSVSLHIRLLQICSSHQNNDTLKTGPTNFQY